jgi:hypothetical protein
VFLARLLSRQEPALQKCYYHGKTDAATVCIGCKMPVCQTCNAEGQKGFCQHCMKKVSTLGERVTDAKKTGFSRADQKATVLKAAPRAPGRDARYCFHHAEILASAACLTCNRPFCPGCLNTQGTCSHCARQNEAEPARGAERGRRVVEAPDEEAPAGLPLPKQVAIAAVVALVVVVGGMSLMKKPADRVRSQTAETLEKLRRNELTPKERALMAQLDKESKNAVSIGDAPAAAPPAERDDGGAGAYVPAVSVGGGRSRPASVRTGGGSSLRVRVAAPAVVSGMTTIRASVSGEPERVELLVDGQWAGTSNSPPFTFDWSSEGVRNGRHRVTVTAYGPDGRRAAGGAVITVRN